MAEAAPSNARPHAISSANRFMGPPVSSNRVQESYHGEIGGAERPVGVVAVLPRRPRDPHTECSRQKLPSRSGALAARQECQDQFLACSDFSTLPVDQAPRDERIEIASHSLRLFRRVKGGDIRTEARDVRDRHPVFLFRKSL